MRHILSVLVLALTMPVLCIAQQANDTPAGHGTPQSATRSVDTASKPAVHHKKHKKPASETTSLDGTPQTEIHGTPQGQAPQK